ncbi:hypothetical protein CNMCM5623_003392 [Aspergillus felis]|uniref:HRQ family protein n=1 Tax=Aspergillus felis TaxID=1287682 RepID=A0A8H6V1Y7_9EURO|nr:hypothetical protein CNMCM5623_003392 [Aspergillus felis]
MWSANSTHLLQIWEDFVKSSVLGILLLVLGLAVLQSLIKNVLNHFISDSPPIAAEGRWPSDEFQHSSPGCNCCSYPPIEALPDFDWKTAEPLIFRPFKPKYNMTMGLSNLDPSSLIPMDKTYEERMNLRKFLLDKYPDIVVGINNETDPDIRSAIEELYAFVLKDYLPTRYPTMFRLLPAKDNAKEPIIQNKVTGDTFPATLDTESRSAIRGLEILGQIVDEDFMILLPRAYPKSWAVDGKQCCQLGNPNDYVLEAYTTYFPSGFDPREKLGLPLSQIHSPVPGYKERLQRSMDRFFDKLPVGKFMMRVNWTITTDLELFASHNEAQFSQRKGTIKPEELDINSAIKNEGLGEELASAIEGLEHGNTPMMYEYKGGPVWARAVKEYLRN